MNNLEDAMKNCDVDIGLLKHASNLQWSGPSGDVSYDNYDLTIRHSEKSLIERAVRELKEAEMEYKRKVKSVGEFYMNNINYVRKMDEKLPEMEKDWDSINENTCVQRCPLCSKVELRLKRHLETIHKDISTEVLQFSLACSKVMYQNSLSRSKVEIKTNTKEKQKKPANFARRKGNYKECPLCKTLQLNLSCHLSNVHDLKGPKHQSERERLCRAPPTIPICFTKLERNVRVMKTDEEIAEAEDMYGEIIETQNEELSNLKAAAKEVDDLKAKMIDTDDIKIYHKLKRELIMAEEKFKILRYSDKRDLSQILKLWRDEFVKSLADTKVNNPARAGNMAVDVFLPWERIPENSLDWRILLNGLKMKEILQCFIDSSKLTHESKIKYMRMALQMVNFVIFDIESPEAIDRDDGAIHSKFATTKLEFQKKMKVSAKEQADENLSRRESTSKKLLNDDELIAIKKEIEEFMIETVKDFPKDYGLNEIYKIRDYLVCEGTILMGRRSKEICNMLKSEVELAQEIDVDGKRMHVVLVKEHKRKGSGKPAGVVFSDSGFIVLNYYIKHLLTTICDDQFNPYVFPRKKSLGNVGEPLTLPEHNCILQTKGINGKTVSSRSVRGSYITIDRMNNSSFEQRQTLADGMSHSLPVADTHYAYTSVVDTVAKSQRAMITSTPVKRTDIGESSSTYAGVSSTAINDVLNSPPNIHKMNDSKRKLEDGNDFNRKKNKICTLNESRDSNDSGKMNDSLNSCTNTPNKLDTTHLHLRSRTVKVKKML